MRKLAALLALAVPLAAQAQFFVEGTFGAAKADLNDFRDQGFAADEAAGTWSVGMGYMFNRHLGIEAGYRAIGDIEIGSPGGASGSFAGLPFVTAGPAALEADARGIYVGPVFETYIERFRLLGRIGMFLWESEVDVSGAGTYAGQAIPAAGIRDKRDGLDPYVGLGVSYSLTDRAFLGLSWTGYRVLDEIRVDAWDLRLKFSF